MAKHRESITSNGRAVFYAAIWNDLRQAAMDCGWALGLHGSLNSDGHNGYALDRRSGRANRNDKGIRGLFV